MDQSLTPDEQIKAWIDRVVIGENLCPFARDARDQTRIIMTDLDKLDGDIEQVLSELTQANRFINNALVIVPNGLESFDDFWNICEALEDNLERSGLVAYVQLAHFHPDYCFDELHPDDRANWTNRSPYPVLHFLCAQTVESRIHSFSDPEAIPERNIQHLRGLSESEFRKRFLNQS